MKKVEITVYEYSELSEEAKKKALRNWADSVDDPFMQSHMINLLKEELDARGIEYDEDSMDVRYSLSYCQGDGFMFEGSLQWKGVTVVIKHSGRYYHSYSKEVTWYNAEGDEIDPVHASTFEKMYQEVCKEMETQGYDYIEYMTSEERFLEECDAGDYTFEANGTMRNA